MRASADHILTSHAGSLPRPVELIEANRARTAGDATDEDAFLQKLRAAVGEVVRRQRDLGIDVPGDGEFGKAMGQRGAWRIYSFSRLGGLEFGGPSSYDSTPRRSRPGAVVLTNFADRRDRARFAGSCSRIGNAYYKSDEEFVYACAEAMREEYKAILDAGLVLQFDDPAIAENWDAINPEPSVEDYKKFTMVRVEALNHAIRGLPQDRIRFHLCWGSWHGPHTTDIPMRDIVEVMLAINAHAYSFEAGNVRHEHEWKVWQDVRLPDGKLILPGVVSHATNVVEHPELVAERILRFTNLVGRERVIASTDCGLGGRVHPDIAWAKLEALAQGAALASRQLWR
jgi:5-methyltetrahydropteroyltriglutamate--homocysteine methyltransferase